MIKDVIKTIDQIATEDPQRIAYDYLGETNTYGDLKARSDAYAAKINELDLPEKAPVMIWGGKWLLVLLELLKQDMLTFRLLVILIVNVC